MILYFIDSCDMLPRPTPEQEKTIRPVVKKFMEFSKQMKIKFLLVDSDHLQKTGKIRYV